MNPQQVAELIHRGLAGSRASVTSEDNVHFEAVVVAAAFAGKRAVAAPPAGVRDARQRDGQ